MKWITRERVKVDRVACPWLIRKFVDPQAQFLFVPAEKVMEMAHKEQAIPYDVKDVELGHHGQECSFDAIVNSVSSPLFIVSGWARCSLVSGLATRILRLGETLATDQRTIDPSTDDGPRTTDN